LGKVRGGLPGSAARGLVLLPLAKIKPAIVTDFPGEFPNGETAGRRSPGFTAEFAALSCLPDEGHQVRGQVPLPA